MKIAVNFDKNITENKLFMEINIKQNKEQTVLNTHSRENNSGYVQFIPTGLNFMAWPSPWGRLLLTKFMVANIFLSNNV